MFQTMPPIIAIPSHCRLDQIQSKTLAMLHRNNIEPELIYIFVSPYSYPDYRSSLHDYHIIESFNTILQTRNHIIQFFDEGQEVVEIDDDVEDILNVQTRETADIQSIIAQGFSHGTLWGIAANLDARQKSKAGLGLRSIINSFLGYVNKRNIQLTLSEKEDFERVIRFWESGHNIYKMPMYGVRTRYWTNPGGIQDHYQWSERLKVQETAANILSQRWPHLVYNVQRESGIVDTRFRYPWKNFNSFVSSSNSSWSLPIRPSQG